ncbi:hypothetical protein [Lysobacter sp. yr284]|uniref:hypothetical protein n=1 Tax=Lysobacter sp. yr284 TaxID=1761791 RepID=UPI001113745D|nr:hypothetical protein [Lysobacter sp. yr284]
MNFMAFMCASLASMRLACVFALTAAVAGLTSCGTVATRASTQPPPAGPADATTLENLLRWPLEGEGGQRRAEAALHRVFVMKPLQARQFSGDGPVKLADGNVLSFAWIGELSGQIDIGVAAEPCVSPELAAGWIGARAEATQDAHGTDRGSTYKAQSAGIRVEFTTTPSTYRCIDSINIYPAATSAR